MKFYNYFIISIFIIMSTNFEANCMRTKFIPKDLLDKCERVIHEYILRTRGWDKNQYVIKYRGVEKKYNIAIFSVNNNLVYEIIEKNRRSYPHIIPSISKDLYLTLVVDIIDIHIISENSPDSIFPNAGKPLPYTCP